MADAQCFAFVDLAGYTALTEAHGDEDAAEVAARFYEIARAAAHGGTRVVKRIGDAVMLVGDNATECTRAVLRMFEQAAAQDDFLGLRSGIHAGPAVERDGDFFGASVNLAARYAAYARAGEILCGQSVAAALEHAPDLCIERLGLVTLKNIKDDVELFSILVPSLAAIRDFAAVDPVCQMRVARSAARRVNHGGREYRFCSEGCAAEFESAPERYVRGP